MTPTLLTWTIRFTPAAPAASAKPRIASTLTACMEDGSRVSPARLKMRETPFVAASRTPLPSKLPRTVSTRPTHSDGRRSRFRVTTRTDPPLSSRLLIRCRPIKPVAPVTRIAMPTPKASRTPTAEKLFDHASVKAAHVTRDLPVGFLALQTNIQQDAQRAGVSALQDG